MRGAPSPPTKPFGGLISTTVCNGATIVTSSVIFAGKQGIKLPHGLGQ